MRIATSVVLVVTATLWAGVSSAQNTLSFTGLFERRSAACHDSRGGNQQAPNRHLLSQMSPDRVYAAITTGSMVPNTIGLTEQDKLTLVVGLTGRMMGAVGSFALDADGGRVCVPVTSLEGPAGANLPYECCTFRGSVVALDASTWRQIWKRYTIPDPARSMRTNSESTQLFGPAGGAVWSTPTLDRTRGLLYFGSGNDYISPPSRCRMPSSPSSSRQANRYGCASWFPAPPPMSGAV